MHHFAQWGLPEMDRDLFPSVKGALLEYEYGPWTPTGYKYVLGSYLAWGKVVMAEKGARVQYAKPEYMILPKDEDYALECMTLAENYKMTMITEEQAPELQTGFIEGKALE